MNKAACLVVLGVLLVSGLGIPAIHTTDTQAWAESSPSQPSGKLKGNIMRGREIFNGKGVCYYCHGIDGYLYRIIPDQATLFLELRTEGVDSLDLTPLQYQRQTETPFFKTNLPSRQISAL